MRCCVALIFAIVLPLLTQAQVSISPNDGSRSAASQARDANMDEVVIIPFDFPIGNDLKDLGKIASPYKRVGEANDFKAQLGQVSLKVKARNGNVLRVTSINDFTHINHYQIKGEAYFTNNPEALRKNIEKVRNKKFDSGSMAYLVIYRPDNIGINRIRVYINDTPVQVMTGEGSRYIYRVKREGRYKIADDNKDSLTVDLRYGNSYYVKMSFETGYQTGMSIKHHGYWSSIKSVDNYQGELESSVVKNTFIAAMGQP